MLKQESDGGMVNVKRKGQTDKKKENYWLEIDFVKNMNDLTPSLIISD